MKSFACGDVVPGCTAIFRGSEAEIMQQVAHHARNDHGMTEGSSSVVEQVRSNIR